MPLSEVGRSMTWGEALRLTKILSADGSSQVGAAVGAWSHTMSREAMWLANLYDLLLQVNSEKRVKPTPRPWDSNNATPETGVTTQRGDAGGRSHREVVELLNSLGHHLPMPDETEVTDG